MSRVLALSRFHVAGYIRSFRILHPLVAVALLLMIVIITPIGGDPKRQLLTSFADLAALAFPIWAWTARAVLDTEPDVQRDLSLVAAGGPGRSIAAGLLGAYAVNCGLALVAVAWLVASGVAYGVRPAAMLLMIALHLLVAVPATVVGAWTCRAVLARSDRSIMALIAACVAILLLSLGPLHWLSVPMVGWMRAADSGPVAFAAAFPGLAVHILVWSAVAGAGYVAARRLRA